MKFTVAITVWRRPYFLPHAVQSVIAQSHRDWEMRVYSDGSSREAEQVVAQIESEFPVSYHRLPRRPRLRGNHLRRTALEEAEGSHVCIVGHDCVLYPTYLETHARNINDVPQAVSVVPIAYWKNFLRRRSLPVSDDLHHLGEGEIDLLCIAFPKTVAVEADCFGRSMDRLRHADFLSFEALRRLVDPVLHRGPEQAAHF